VARSGRRERSSRHTAPAPLGAAIGDLAKNLGIAGTLRQYDVLTRWPELVGEQVAKVSSPQRIDRGVLFVSVTTAPWRAELTLRRREILERIARAVGRGVVTDIRFR